jgi:ankyrin repeat protein
VKRLSRRAWYPILGVLLSLPILGLPIGAADQAPEPARFRDAATRGYAAIQVAQKASRTSQSCMATCHLQMYGAFALRSMVDGNLPFDEPLARADALRALGRTATNLSAAVEGNSLGEIAMNEAFSLVAAHAIGLRRSVVTSAVARAVALKQNPAGDWPALRQRPPSNHSPFTFTALGLRSLQLYGHPRQKEDLDRRIDRARAWLQSHAPPDTESRSYQLLGLAWAGAPADALAPLVNALAAAQRDDGGWNSLEGRESDVYSTAQALVSLHQAGAMPSTDPVWRRGLDFLLRMQAGDGTWHVRTRLPPWVSPPYFESGYPYGRDQFISVAAANWSVRAIALALQPAAAAPRLPLAEIQPDLVEPWVETVMFGSADDLRTLLDEGLDPNAATKAEGLTPLMLAVPDVEKVRLLVDRGANVNARSRARFSALLVAAQYREATASIRELLARGARVASGSGRDRAAADAYPTFLAAQTGNAEILPELRQAGDALDAPALMFGGGPVPPLLAAAFFDHLEVGRTLLDLGAKADPPDQRFDSALVAAVCGNDVDFARLLIERGADVNRADDQGMTPLMFAAVADFGDSAMVDLLLASGARTTGRDKAGRSAGDYAQQYGHSQLITRLTR